MTDKTNIRMVCKKGTYIIPQRIIIFSDTIRVEADCINCAYGDQYDCRPEDGVIDIAIKEVQNEV